MNTAPARASRSPKSWSCPWLRSPQLMITLPTAARRMPAASSRLGRSRRKSQEPSPTKTGPMDTSTTELATEV